jgi:hypothetical protein
MFWSGCSYWRTSRRVPEKRTITLAPAMAEKTSTALTERSIPAVMMTKVAPIASISRMAASTAMLRKLVVAANFSPCQTLKTTSRPARTT